MSDDQPLPPGRGGVRERFMTPENAEHIPSGIVVDGAVYPLEGQPPVATTHGWGNLSWLLVAAAGRHQSHRGS